MPQVKEPYRLLESSGNIIPVDYSGLVRSRSITESNLPAVLVSYGIPNEALPDPILNKRVLLPVDTYNVPGSPALSWDEDAERDSGLYRIAANNYGESVNGVLAYDWNATRLLSAIIVWLPNGTAAAPALSFSADTGQNLGLFRIGEDNLGLAANGVLQWDYNTTRLFSAGQKIFLGADAEITANDIVSIDKTINGSVRASLINRSGGTVATSGFYALNENILGVEFGLTGSSWTPFGNFNANEAFIACDSGVPLLINVPTGQGLRVATGNTVRWTLNLRGELTWTATAATSGSPTMLSFTAAAHTGLAADTEASDVIFNLGRTVQFTSGAGAFASQRAVRITAPTYSATAAETVTDAATFYINDAPTAGPNMTLTNRYAIFVDAGDVRLDGKLLVGGELEVDGAFNHDGTTVGFYGVTPVARSAAYTPTNVTTDRSYDANLTSLDEIADVLGTLLQDLTLTGIIG